MVGIVKERFSIKELAIAFDRTEPTIMHWYYNGHIERHHDDRGRCYFKREDVKQLLLDINAGKHNPCAIDVKKAAKKLKMDIDFPETDRFRWSELRDSTWSYIKKPTVPSIEIPTNTHLKCNNRQSYINEIAKLKPTGYVNRQ